MLSAAQQTQGSSEWLALRRAKVTATDAPIIMGENPWTTPVQLYRRKLGLEPEIELNDDMRRGMALEPEARECASAIYGNLVPAVVLHEEHPFMMASLDGICEFSEALIEIKCPRIEAYKKIEKYGVPLHYKGQLQHILACTGYQSLIFFCYWNPGIPSFQEFTVVRDDDYIRRMIERERLFYRCLINMHEPTEVYESYEVL